MKRAPSRGNPDHHLFAISIPFSHCLLHLNAAHNHVGHSPELCSLLLCTVRKNMIACVQIEDTSEPEHIIRATLLWRLKSHSPQQYWCELRVEVEMRRLYAVLREEVECGLCHALRQRQLLHHGFPDFLVCRRIVDVLFAFVQLFKFFGDGAKDWQSMMIICRIFQRQSEKLFPRNLSRRLSQPQSEAPTSAEFFSTLADY